MSHASGARAGTQRPNFLDRWFRRRIRPDLPLRLAYRQIFILPTRFGWMLGLLMAAMLIGSLNFNNNLGLLTTFLVAATAINSMLLAYRNLQGLRLHQGLAQPVHAGDHVRWRLAVTEPGARAREGLVLSAPGTHTLFDAPAGGSSEVIIDLATSRRGWQRVGRLRIATTQPLGLFRAWSWLEPSTPFLVWPRPAVDAPPLPETGTAQRGRQQPALEEGEEFHSLRGWRESDPLHRIAWKASQRHQTLLSREFRQERARDVALSLATTPGRDAEERIRILTAWILRAEQDRRPWSLDTGATRLGPGLGDTHKHAGLRALAEL